MAGTRTGARLPPAVRTAALVARLTWLLGAISVASALLPGQRARLHTLTRVVPTPASATATAVTAALGVLLLYLAGGLRRRHRRAWRAAVAASLILVASHVLKGLDLEEAAVSLAVLGLLIASRREFRAAGDPTTRWLALRALVELPALGTGLGLVLLRLDAGEIAGPAPLGDQLRHVLLGLVGIPGPVRFTDDQSGDVVTATLLGFGLLTAFVTAYLALRPAEPATSLTSADEDRLRALLARHGARDSLGYFALRRDKGVVWSPSGKAAVTWRVVHGVLLASGDPVGDPEAWPGAVVAFLDLARAGGWIPAVLGCGEQGATVYRRHGLDALELGDEAVLDVATFGLEGRAMRGVRQAVARVERAGYRVVVRRARDVPAVELAELRAAAGRWRGRAPERGFSMALCRLGDPGDGDCVVVTAYTDGPTGPVLRGLLHLVPWGSDGLSLDLMRRDRSADNGLNELLVVRLVAAGPELGVRRVSLNFAVFRSTLERAGRIGSGPVLRLCAAVLRFASRWLQIESLYRFNLKFRPEWAPRFVSFASAADLPRIAVAALRAEAFLLLPARLARLVRRSGGPAPVRPLSPPAPAATAPAAASPSDLVQAS